MAGEGKRGQCVVCSHEKREMIDAALLGGAPYRVISETYGMSPGTISKHKTSGHIGVITVAPSRAVDIAPIEGEATTIEQANASIEALRQMAHKEMAAGQNISAIKAFAELRQWVEFRSKATGELREGVQSTTVIDNRKQVIQYFEGKSPEDIRAMIAYRLSELSGAGEALAITGAAPGSDHRDAAQGVDSPRVVGLRAVDVSRDV